MRRQKQIWTEEHRKPSLLPGLSSGKPSEAIISFLKFLDGKIHINNAVDIGSGKGRNSIYLAENGIEVYCLEYVEEAINITNDLAIARGLSDKIHTFNVGIDETWPFKDNFFDISIDYFSSIDVETKEGRDIYKKEMLRTLKPGGYAFVGVVSADDEMEISFPKGNEPNSVIWPTGKFQKNYDEDELKSFYKDFEIVSLMKIPQNAFKLDKDYTATNFHLILRKP